MYEEIKKKPEGSQGESRLPVHFLLLPVNDSALDPVTLPPEFRSEQSDRLDTCCLDPPAVLWRKDDLPRESPEPVLHVPGLHPDIMVIEPDAEPSGCLRVEVDRVSSNLDASGGGAAGVLRFLRLLRRIASVICVTAFVSAHSWAAAAACSRVSLIPSSVSPCRPGDIVGPSLVI